MSDSTLLAAAYIVDLIFGDPRRLPHPVRIIGAAIEWIETMLRKIVTAPRKSVDEDFISSPAEGEGWAVSRERAAGVLLVTLIVGMTFALFSGLSRVLRTPAGPPVFSYVLIIVFIYLIASTLATRELVHSARSVINAVHAGDTDKARSGLSMIVGRDTQDLDNRSMLRAAIETLSENASDGIIAPLFYFAVGGLPLAMTYKAINTLDSMVGYKNEKYRNIGWAAARLDDIANFIPARITGGIIVIAAALTGVFQRLVQYNAECFSPGRKRSEPDPSGGPLHPDTGGTPGHHQVSGRSAMRIMLRDGALHASPNSGIPEAAMAGALGVKLGGPSSYGGVVNEKPFIGDEQHDSETFYFCASLRALTVTRVTSIIGLLAALLILYGRTLLWN